jgi:hypothetical protein
MSLRQTRDFVFHCALLIVVAMSGCGSQEVVVDEDDLREEMAIVEAEEREHYDEERKVNAPAAAPANQFHPEERRN